MLSAVRLLLLALIVSPAMADPEAECRRLAEVERLICACSSSAAFLASMLPGPPLADDATNILSSSAFFLA